MSKLKIVSRQSKLAIRQTQIVTELLHSKIDLDTEVIAIKTRGDKELMQSLSKLGGKGLFVSELEDYLIQRRADIAVHSAKDLPATTKPLLQIGAVLERTNAQDVLLSKKHQSLDELQDLNFTLGTSSLRRALQAQQLFPKANIKFIRGNVDTRIKKMLAGEFDAIILAQAGLQRLGLNEYIIHEFSSEQMVPAAGQGTLAVECRTIDKVLLDILHSISCQRTWHELTLERMIVKYLGANCQAPLGVKVGVDLLNETTAINLFASKNLVTENLYIQEQYNSINQEEIFQQFAKILIKHDIRNLIQREVDASIIN